MGSYFLYRKVISQPPKKKQQVLNLFQNCSANIILIRQILFSLSWIS